MSDEKRPEIKLFKIDMHVGLSDETPCYTASVFVDGEHFCDVENHGQGGPDMSCAPRGKSLGFQYRLAALNDRIGRTFPSHDFSGMTIKEDLEMLCHGRAWEFVDKRNMRSKLYRTVMTIEDGAVYSYKGKKCDQLIAKVVAKKPNAIVLNNLPFDEAWEKMKEASA